MGRPCCLSDRRSLPGGLVGALDLLAVEPGHELTGWARN
jgi:hypothetical protein